MNHLAWKKVLEQDLIYIGEELREQLEGRSCIILSGEVGAGKTTFIQNFMKSSSSEEQVLSPTYNIIYEQGDCAHADFYRIEDSQEIVHLEMGLYAEEKDFFLIEWGKPYLREIRSQLGEQFSYYELTIEINAGDDPTSATRNINLVRLS